MVALLALGFGARAARSQDGCDSSVQTHIDRDGSTLKLIVRPAGRTASAGSR
jgi:hypothetical protein